MFRQALAVSLLLLLAPPSGRAQAPDGGPPSRAVQPPGPEAPRGEEPSHDRSEDQLFVDPESGESYRVAPVELVRGQYRFMDEARTRIRLKFGVEARVERVEGDTVWIRVYESRKKKAPATVAVPPTVQDVVPPTTEGRLAWDPIDEGLPKEGLWREGMAFGDFDGDGGDELVVPPPRKARSYDASPRIYRRHGDRWSAWGEASFPEQTYDYGDVAVLDYDRDGINDIALAMHLTGVQLMRGRGGGVFERVDGFPSGGTLHARSVVALEHGAGPLLLAFGEGMAGASPLRVETPTDGVVNRGLHGWGFVEGRFERIDGEGTEIRMGFGDDFAVGDPTGRGQHWLALGSLRLRAREVLVRLVEDEAGRRFEPSVLPLLQSSAYLGAVSFLDADGDGRDELYYGSQTTRKGTKRTHLDRYRMDPGEEDWSGEAIVSIPSGDGIWSLAGGDLNGDGFDDVVAGTGGGEIWVFLADAQGALRRDLSLGLPEPSVACAVRDLVVRKGANGAPEVFALFSGEPVSDPTGLATRGTGCENGGRIAAWKVREGPSSSPTN